MDTFRLTLIFLGLAVLFVIYLLEAARRRKQRAKRRQREQQPSLDGGPFPDDLGDDTPNLGLRMPRQDNDDQPSDQFAAGPPIGAGLVGGMPSPAGQPPASTVPEPDADMSAAWQQAPASATPPAATTATPQGAAVFTATDPAVDPAIDSSAAATNPLRPPEAEPEASSQPTEAAPPPGLDEADEVPEPPEGFSDLIIALQISAPENGRFGGRAIQDALRHCGIEYGEMKIYHYYTPRRRSLFYIANAMEPGSFDLTDMATLATPGVVFFLRLPTVLKGLEAFDLMLDIARRVAEHLGGDLQDQQGTALGKHELTGIRERIAAYEYKLKAHQRQMAAY